MKLKSLAVLMLLLLLGTIQLSSVSACTSFYLADRNARIFGFNFDWSMGHGYLIVNKRDVRKTAMPGHGNDPGPWAAWTSRYGSLTFNQYGREMPMGGMNETGLVVHMMMLRATRYPLPDSRPAIKDLQWVQYHLDNFSRVAQVIDGSRKIRITREEPGLHYLIADRTGDCAVVEFIDGRLLSYSGKALKASVVTNNVYKDAVNHLRKHRGFGFEWPIPSGQDSLSRFVRAAHWVQQYNPGQQFDPVKYGFEILNSVRQASTRWSLVYDLQARQVYFRTFANPRIRRCDFESFNFACDEPAQVLSITASSSENVSDHFTAYTPLVNRDMIKKAFKGSYFFEFMPHTLVEKRVRYPETTTCIK